MNTTVDHSLASRTKSIAAAFTKAVEFDIKIAEDRLQYSSWLLAIAAAGLGISITQAKPVIEATFLAPLLADSASKVALLAAATSFVASAASGAVVKVFTGKEVESSRQRLTLVELQNIWVEAGENEKPPDGDVSDLVRAVCECHLLSHQKKEEYKKFKETGKRAEKLYERALVAQQAFAGVGYATLLLIAMF